MFHLNFHCAFTRFCEGIVQYIFKYYLQFMLCVSNKSDLSSEMSSPQLLLLHFRGPAFSYKQALNK